MNGTDLLTTRRSVRKFKDQAVTAEDIKGIIEIAKYAPSWKNTQTPRYIAVLDDDMKKQVASDCVLGFESNQKTISAAPALIVVTTIDGRSGYEKDGTPTTSKGTHWQSFDAGIATQTFCLADVPVEFVQSAHRVVGGNQTGDVVADPVTPSNTAKNLF